MAWDDFISDEAIGGALTAAGCAVLLGAVYYATKHPNSDSLYLKAGLTILGLISLAVLLGSTLEYTDVTEGSIFEGANEYGIAAGSVGLVTAFGGWWRLRGEQVSFAEKNNEITKPNTANPLLRASPTTLTDSFMPSSIKDSSAQLSVYSDEQAYNFIISQNLPKNLTSAQVSSIIDSAKKKLTNDQVRRLEEWEKSYCSIEGSPCPKVEKSDENWMLPFITAIKLKDSLVTQETRSPAKKRA